MPCATYLLYAHSYIVEHTVGRVYTGLYSTSKYIGWYLQEVRSISHRLRFLFPHGNRCGVPVRCSLGTYRPSLVRTVRTSPPPPATCTRVLYPQCAVCVYPALLYTLLYSTLLYFDLLCSALALLSLTPLPWLSHRLHYSRSHRSALLRQSRELLVERLGWQSISM